MSAAFWASGRHQIATKKSPELPTIAKESTPKANGSIAMIFKRMVLKKNFSLPHKDTHSQEAQVNGVHDTHGVSTPPKQVQTKFNGFHDWANDDDEDMADATPVQKILRIAELEGANAEQAGRIDELDHVVVTKGYRIQELEDTLSLKEERIQQLTINSDDMAHRIEDLERFIDDKVQRIDNLEEAVYFKYLHIQELVDEVDEKDRRILQLEGELNVKAARVHIVEAPAPESSVRLVIQSPETEPVAKVTEFNKPKAQVVIPVTDPTLSGSTKADSMLEDNGWVEVNTTEDHKSSKDPISPPSKQMQEVATPKMSSVSSSLEIIEVDALTEDSAPLSGNEALPEAAPKSSPLSSVDSTSNLSLVVGPTSSVRKESTPTPQDIYEPIFATVETIKKVAPVPPAPKLKLGIDMSKWNKQKVSDPKPPVKESRARRPSSQKTDEIPVIDPQLDVRKISLEKRRLFGNGGDVEIAMGTYVATAPKYMAMQVSKKIQDFFREHPEATRIDFPADSMDTDALNEHIDWMKQHLHVGRVFSVHLSYENDARNLNICRAARVLGLNNIYVGHFTRHYCERIRSKMQPLELISLIDGLAWPENEPIWDCLVNNLANERRRDNLPAHMKGHFSEFLAMRPRMTEAIAKIEDKIASSRMAKINKEAGGKINITTAASKC